MEGANLSGADLSFANLARADLEEADLSEAKLYGVTRPIRFSPSQFGRQAGSAAAPLATAAIINSTGARRIIQRHHAHNGAAGSTAAGAGNGTRASRKRTPHPHRAASVDNARAPTRCTRRRNGGGVRDLAFSGTRGRHKPPIRR